MKRIHVLYATLIFTGIVRLGASSANAAQPPLVAPQAATVAHSQPFPSTRSSATDFIDSPAPVIADREYAVGHQSYSPFVHEGGIVESCGPQSVCQPQSASPYLVSTDAEWSAFLRSRAASLMASRSYADPPQPEPAEIWMRFPRGSNPSVSVNLTEYPPAGDFRVFRTVVPHGEVQRYYFAATALSSTGPEYLAPANWTKHVTRDEFSEFWYVDLVAGDQCKIRFCGTASPLCPPYVSVPLGPTPVETSGPALQSEFQPTPTTDRPDDDSEPAAETVEPLRLDPFEPIQPENNVAPEAQPSEPGPAPSEDPLSAPEPAETAPDADSANGALP